MLTIMDGSSQIIFAVNANDQSRVGAMYSMRKRYFWGKSVNWLQLKGAVEILYLAGRISSKARSIGKIIVLSIAYTKRFFNLLTCVVY